MPEGRYSAPCGGAIGTPLTPARRSLLFFWKSERLVTKAAKLLEGPAKEEFYTKMNDEYFLK
jgi:hypothetical protein